jgi:hypothetical protein
MMKKLEEQLHELETKINIETSFEECQIMQNQISAMEEDALSHLHSEIKYAGESLLCQSKDFDFLTNLTSDLEKTSYMSTMTKNSQSMYNGTLKNIHLIELLKRCVTLSSSVTEKIAYLSSQNKSYIINSENSNNKASCKFDCITCLAQKDPLMFCMDGCKPCSVKIKAEEEFFLKKTKRTHLQQLYLANKKTIQNVISDKDTINNSNKGTLYNFDNENNTQNDLSIKCSKREFPDNLMIGPRYYYVMLSSDPADGDNSYIKTALINNFLKILSPYSKIESHTYVVTFDENNIITLHGLLKQHSSSKCISNTTSIFSNKIKNQNTKKTNNRYKEIKNLQ